MRGVGSAKLKSMRVLGLAVGQIACRWQESLQPGKDLVSLFRRLQICRVAPLNDGQGTPFDRDFNPAMSSFGGLILRSRVLCFIPFVR